MSEDREFKKHSTEALTAIQRDLVLASDDYGFESSLQSGTITISFSHPPGKFTIHPDQSTEQLKLALGARTVKLDWDIVENSFVQIDTRQTLKEVLEQAISKYLKQDVEL